MACDQRMSSNLTEVPRIEADLGLLGSQLGAATE